ncbi:hypothetical protein OAF47_01215 [bacterium]|nr:hypothetical protein [bacterium]
MRNLKELQELLMAIATMPPVASVTFRVGCEGKNCKVSPRWGAEVQGGEY